MKNKLPLLTLFFLAAFSLCNVSLGATATTCLACNINFVKTYDVKEYINTLEEKYNFDRNYLINLFSQVELLPEVIKSMKHPYEEIPWDKYRNAFLSEERINGGTIYWQNHRLTLTKAQQEFSVPPEIIVAIVGIESLYGKHFAEHPIFNALATLAFEYPARENFFKNELTQYLLLCRELKLDPLTTKGSYAGAMGLPQFMPDSYRLYAVDFTGLNKKDLFHDNADVIGSVANFLHAKGWQKNQPIAVKAEISNNKFEELFNNNPKAKYSLTTLAEYGIKPVSSVDSSSQVGLLEFINSDQSKEYWIVFDNFYVLTRYNSSVQYAMTAYLLANEIKNRMGENSETKTTTSSTHNILKPKDKN